MLDLTYYLRGYAISNTAMLVYGLLDGLSKASGSQQKGYTYISRQSIAERIHKCERTARKAVKELEAVGLIKVKRMGRGLNDRIFVFAPNTPAAEKEGKVEGADLSVYRTETAKNAALIDNTQKAINNHIDISINPANATDNAAKPQMKGQTAPKGRPTNKRPQRNVEERQRLRKKYRDYLRQQLKVEEYDKDIFTYYEDVEALKKMVDLMANTMVSKAKIMVNGALITNQQWWYVVKNISQNAILDIIWAIPKYQNVRNLHAYLLATIYNTAIQEQISKPWFVNREANYAY